MTFSEGISLLLKNFGFVLFVLAIILALIDWPIQRIMRKKISLYEIFFRWIVLLPLGLTAIYAFIMHAFFPNLAASTIGWDPSPFQFETAAANLGVGVIAILSFKASYGFRLATVISATLFLWLCAVGHLVQMFINKNYTIGNVGSWFWMDIIIPLVLIILISRLKTVSNQNT